MNELLSDDEMSRWVAWKRATEAVMGAVATDVATLTSLSSADFSVLTRVVEVNGHSIRQQRLSDELGWDRSRLSRQLVRMEERDLVKREGDTTERRVTATPSGHDHARRARLAHAAAVKRCLLDATSETTDEFWQTIRLLAGSRAAARTPDR